MRDAAKAEMESAGAAAPRSIINISSTSGTHGNAGGRAASSGLVSGLGKAARPRSTSGCAAATALVTRRRWRRAGALAAARILEPDTRAHNSPITPLRRPPGQANYAAGKAAVVGLTKTVAKVGAGGAHARSGRAAPAFACAPACTPAAGAATSTLPLPPHP